MVVLFYPLSPLKDKAGQKLQSLFNRDLTALPSAEYFLLLRPGDSGGWATKACGKQCMSVKRWLENLGKLREQQKESILLKAQANSGQTSAVTAQQIESLLNCIQRLANLPKEILRTRQLIYGLAMHLRSQVPESP